MATMATALLILLMAAPMVLGANYKVGDAAGWDSGVDYTAWASDKTFTVGDTLEFNYATNHKVNEVSEDDYNGCTTNKVLKSNGGTTATIELTEAGKRYFLCPTAGHCLNGMKLLVNVVASSSGTPPTTTSSPPPPSSGSPSGGGSTSPPASGGNYSPPPPSTPSGAWTARVCGMNIVIGALLLLAFMG